MGKRYDADVRDSVWAMVEPHLPPARPRDNQVREIVATGG